MRKRQQKNFLQSWSVMGSEEVKGYSSGSETLSNSEIEGRKIVFNGSVFTVLKRKNELDKKPPYYLLDLEHKVFLSSLYPTGESNTYIFDVKGEDVNYILRFTPNGYEIEEIKK
ncbi:MAG: hypothetical protein ACP5IN_07955 [Caldimicrobium sp.]